MDKKKVKFTVIDALIIVVVLAALAVGGIKVLPMFTNSQETQKVECTVLISSAEKALADAMKVGDKVTMSLTEKDGGIIKNIEVTPATKTVFDSISGEYVAQKIENKCDISVTVEADAVVSDTAVKVGSTVMKVGAETTIRGKGYASMGYMTVIND